MEFFVFVLTYGEIGPPGTVIMTYEMVVVEVAVVMGVEVGGGGSPMDDEGGGLGLEDRFEVDGSVEVDDVCDDSSNSSMALPSSSPLEDDFEFDGEPSLSLLSVSC